MSLEKVLKDIDHDQCTDMGNFYQVTKDGELLGYVLKDRWV